MKRKILFILWLLINICEGYTLSFSAKSKTKMFIPDEELNLNISMYEVIKKNEIIECENNVRLIDCIYFENISNTFAYITTETRDNKYIAINNLVPLNTVNTLSEELVTIYEIGIKKKYIPSYMLDVLKSSDTKKVTEFDSYYAREYRDFLKNDLNSYIAYSFEKKFYYAVISNIGIELHSEDNFIFTNIREISPTKYECTGVGFSKWNPDRENSNYWQTYFENTSELGVESEIIELTLDGDYLSIFNKTRNKEIITLVCIDDTVEKELINLFNSNNCDLSKVTWPRHADGSCDYDNSSTTKPVVAQPSTNVSPNKTMSVTENLKLRSGEATSTTVLTVMQAGTKVKILELGKLETIDGINSNWVKVEVISGKDRDGKEIKKKTTGWCYGGYLK